MNAKHKQKQSKIELLMWLLVNSTIPFSVATVLIYHRTIWALSSEEAAGRNTLSTRDGVQMDRWTAHWDQER